MERSVGVSSWWEVDVEVDDVDGGRRQSEGGDSLFM